MIKIADVRNQAEASLIVHVLQESGIEAVTKGENDALFAPTVWITNDGDLEQARLIIDDIKGNERVQKPAGNPFKQGFLFGIGLGSVIGLIAGLILLDALPGKHKQDESEWDRNRDGKDDQWMVYKTPDAYTIIYDENYDGNPDWWEYYTGGWVIKDESDRDYNGRVDVWGKYRNGYLIQRDWSYHNDSIIDTRIFYKDNLKCEELHDTDRDGRFDRRVLIDNYDRIISQEKLAKPIPAK